MEHMPQQTRIRYKIMRNFVGDASKKIILDIGAGYRPISKGIKSKKTIRLDGIREYDPDITCDINKGLDLSDSSVDIIIAGEIIEHLINPFKFIRECRRVLKKGGEIIISTPNVCSLKNRFKVLIGQLPEYCAEPLDDESYERHIVDFNLPKLIKVLEGEGFKIIKKTTNGIISHSKLIFPRNLTPASFGETLIVKAKK